MLCSQAEHFLDGPKKWKFILLIKVILFLLSCKLVFLSATWSTHSTFIILLFFLFRCLLFLDFHHTSLHSLRVQSSFHLAWFLSLYGFSSLQLDYEACLILQTPFLKFWLYFQSKPPLNLSPLLKHNFFNFAFYFLKSFPSKKTQGGQIHG